VDFTGLDETPLSPNDDAHHPKSRKDSRIASLQETQRAASCFAVRRGSHVIQANAPPFGVTLAGLFATLHRWKHWLRSPGEIAPRFANVFCTSTDRTGRIKSMLQHDCTVLTAT